MDTTRRKIPQCSAVVRCISSSQRRLDSSSPLRAKRSHVQFTRPSEIPPPSTSTHGCHAHVICHLPCEADRSSRPSAIERRQRPARAVRFLLAFVKFTSRFTRKQHRRRLFFSLSFTTALPSHSRSFSTRASRPFRFPKSNKPPKLVEMFSKLFLAGLLGLAAAYTKPVGDKPEVRR